MIIWAGTSSKDVGMVIEHYPSVLVPQKSQEIQTVPGRNGNIVIECGAFEDYEQPYQAFLDAKEIGGLKGVVPKLVDWLMGHEGYQRLEDTYFPDVYRMAYYSGGAEFINIYGEYGEGTLTFVCAPEKFYKSGEWPITLTKGQALFNPSMFPAAPLITVTGTGSCTLTVGGKSLTISDISTQVTLDIKKHKAYASDGSNRSSTITGDYDEMKLGAGKTIITWTGSGVTSVIFVPRWWTI